MHRSTQPAAPPHIYNQEDGPLVSGRLALDVAGLQQADDPHDHDHYHHHHHHQQQRPAKVVWLDTLRRVTAAPADGRRAADEIAQLHEAAAAAPAYVRGCDELLSDAPALGALGTAAEEEEDVARPFLGREGRGGARDPAPAHAAQPQPPKRRRLSSSRCFNCGSYSHSVGQCWRPSDAARVVAAAAELRSSRAAQGGGGGGDAPARYFHTSAAEQLVRAARPGAVGAALAQALGMPHAHAPPPWLARMVVLGVPPAYRGAVPAAAAGGPAGWAEVRVFDDDDSSGGGGGEGGSGSGGAGEVAPAEGAQEAAADGGGGEQAAADGGEGEQAAAEPKPAAAASGEGGARDAPPSSSEDGAETVAFPGVNAQFPPGADMAAWSKELAAAYMAMSAEEALAHRKRLLQAAGATAAEAAT
jgi:hypothetical protein